MNVATAGANGDPLHRSEVDRRANEYRAAGHELECPDVAGGALWTCHATLIGRWRWTPLGVGVDGWTARGQRHGLREAAVVGQRLKEWIGGRYAEAARGPRELQVGAEIGNCPSGAVSTVVSDYCAGDDAQAKFDVTDSPSGIAGYRRRGDVDAAGFFEQAPARGCGVATDRDVRNRRAEPADVNPLRPSAPPDAVLPLIVFLSIVSESPPW